MTYCQGPRTLRVTGSCAHTSAMYMTHPSTTQQVVKANITRTHDACKLASLEQAQTYFDPRLVIA